MKHTTKEANGTSFHNTTIETTLTELIRVCGEPLYTTNDGEDKVNYEFNMETDAGDIFTIYDWKEYRPIAKDEVIEWHIGGKSQYITETAKEELLKAINSEEESKTEHNTVLTENQYDLLKQEIYLTLMAGYNNQGEELGMGEMAECEEVATQIILNWADKANIELP